MGRRRAKRGEPNSNAVRRSPATACWAASTVENSWDLTEPGAPCRRPGSLAQKWLLPKPLFHICGEVFKPAERSDLDPHMLTVLFHDRQIEQDLVDRVWTIHIDHSDHTPGADTLPDVDDDARLLCAQSCFGFAGPNREELPLGHGCRILDLKVSVI